MLIKFFAASTIVELLTINSILGLIVVSKTLNYIILETLFMKSEVMLSYLCSKSWSDPYFQVYRLMLLFLQIQEDAYQDDLGFSTGQLGKGGASGPVRGPTVDKKTQVSISKRLQV